MSGLFRKVPLRDNYKDVPDDIVRLKAPPNISRCCFIFEISVAATAFALSFYISFTSTVSVTSITYEPLGSDYVCKVLSPRSDSLSFSTKTNEMVGFSSARFLLDECLSELDSTGLDVCADNNREDYLLEVSGVPAKDDNCLDIILEDNYRFCYGAEAVYKIATESFPISSSRPSTVYVDPFYYFMNDSSTVRSFAAPFVSLLSDWVAHNGAIYVVATTTDTNRAGLFKLDPMDGSISKDVLTAPVAVARFDVGGSTLIGFAIADDLAHAWFINAQNSMGTLYSTDLTTDVVVSHTYDCTNFADTSYQYGEGNAASVFRYLAASDGYVYAMCGKNVWASAYTFYQISTSSYSAVKLHADIETLSLNKQGVASNDSINSLSTVFVRDGYAYFSTGAPTFNIVRVDLSPQPTPGPTRAPTVQPSVVPSGKPSPAPPSLKPSPFPPSPSPTANPSMVPSAKPSISPTVNPSALPSLSAAPTMSPSPAPSVTMSAPPSSDTSLAPTSNPTPGPTAQPTIEPSAQPSVVPSAEPSSPTVEPSMQPSVKPSVVPSVMPSTAGTSPGTPTGTTAGTPGGSPAPPPGPPPGRRLQHVQLAETISISSEGIEEVLPPPAEPAAMPAAAPGSNWVMQPVVNLGFCEGTSLSQGYGNTVYLSSTASPFASRYYNISSGAFEQYDKLREDYFLTTSVEVGYSFAACNGKVLNVSVDPTISTDYKAKCDDINGIYYQNNHYYTMPATCAHIFNPTSATSLSMDTLQQCAAISALTANYTATNCAASFDKICAAAYTDNPPFSCTINLQPDFLTTLGSALSNAGALWSLIAVLISISLRRVYPGGVLARLYDPKDGQLKSEKHSGRGSGRSAVVHPIHEDEEQPFSKLERADSFGNVEQGGQEMRDRGEGGNGNEGGDAGGASTAGESGMGGGASADPLASNSSNNTKEKPSKKKKKDEEGEDGCCVMLLDECEC